jgi:hypothetical protein
VRSAKYELNKLSSCLIIRITNALVGRQFYNLGFWFWRFLDFGSNEPIVHRRLLGTSPAILPRVCQNHGIITEAHRDL